MLDVLFLLYHVHLARRSDKLERSVWFGWAAPMRMCLVNKYETNCPFVLANLIFFRRKHPVFLNLNKIIYKSVIFSGTVHMIIKSMLSNVKWSKSTAAPAADAAWRHRSPWPWRGVPRPMAAILKPTWPTTSPLGA